MTTPVNLRSGRPVAEAVTGNPRRRTNRYVSGTVKSSFITDVSSSVVMSVPGLTKLPTLTCRKPVRPMNEARITVSSRRDLGGRDARLIGLQRRLDLLEVRHRHRLARLQVAAAVVLALAAGERRLRLGERRASLRRVHLDEHGAALDLLAFVEADRGDRVRRLRRDFHRLVRLRRSDGLDLDAHRLQARGRGYDRDRRGDGGGAGAASGLGGRLSTGAAGECDRRNGRRERHPRRARRTPMDPMRVSAIPA